MEYKSQPKKWTIDKCFENIICYYLLGNLNYLDGLEWVRFYQDQHHTQHRVTERKCNLCVLCEPRALGWATPGPGQAGKDRYKTNGPLIRKKPDLCLLMTMVLIHIMHSGHCLLWSLYHCKICTLLHLMATWHCTVYCPLYTLEYLYATPSNKLAQIGLINY